MEKLPYIGGRRDTSPERSILRVLSFPKFQNKHEYESEIGNGYYFMYLGLLKFLPCHQQTRGLSGLTWERRSIKIINRITKI